MTDAEITLLRSLAETDVVTFMREDNTAAAVARFEATLARQHAGALPILEQSVAPAGALQAGRRPNWASAPVEFSILQCTLRLLCPGLQLNPVSYKGFAITARTFQIRGSGRWTLDLLIGRHRSLRAFSGPRTYSTEQAAITGCCELAQRIIDGRVRDSSVADLS